MVLPIQTTLKSILKKSILKLDSIKIVSFHVWIYSCILKFSMLIWSYRNNIYLAISKQQKKIRKNFKLSSILLSAFLYSWKELNIKNLRWIQSHLIHNLLFAVWCWRLNIKLWVCWTGSLPLSKPQPMGSLQFKSLPSLGQRHMFLLENNSEKLS